MSTTINGSTGVTFPDASTMASAQVGMKNRLIDAGFIINQRGYVSGTSLAAGTYAHDRWKAGSGGGTYTFTQGSLGVPITITITAGTFLQIIEGCNMPEGGTYTVSWTGTAQARVNGGGYSSSPLVVTGLTAGANCTVEFNTGTLLKPQIETGSTATSFDYRPYGTELALCQRYYYKNAPSGAGYRAGTGYVALTTSAYAIVNFPVAMRIAPSALEQSGTATDYQVAFGGTYTACNAVPTISGTNEYSSNITFNVASGLTVGHGCMVRAANTNAYLAWSAEL